MEHRPVRPEVVALVSGGIDSVTMAYWLALEEKKRTAVLFMDLGRLSTPQEYFASKRTAINLGLQFDNVNSSEFWKVLIGHHPESFLNAGEFDRTTAPCSASCGSGFSVVMSIATYYAQMAGIPAFAVGVLDGQLEGGRIEFFTEWPGQIKKLNPDGPPFQVLLPFAGKTKAEVISMAKKLGVPIGETWSCFFGHESHCGRCRSCIKRRNAFADSGVEDQTRYLYEEEIKS